MSSRNETIKKQARRLRRKRSIRQRVFGSSEKPRLTVFRSHKNIYGQVIDDLRGVTLASASTRAKDLRDQVAAFGGNCKAAAAVGKALAEKAKALGIESVQFDRNGYRYHGRVKALVEAARAAGLKI